MTTNSFMLIFVKFYYQRQNHCLNFFNIGAVIDSFPEKILFSESIAILFKELLTLICKIPCNLTLRSS